MDSPGALDSKSPAALPSSWSVSIDTPRRQFFLWTGEEIAVYFHSRGLGMRPGHVGALFCETPHTAWESQAWGQGKTVAPGMKSRGVAQLTQANCFPP